jgi:hypothetical protein
MSKISTAKKAPKDLRVKAVHSRPPIPVNHRSASAEALR